jgi:formylglycine-generating enzyme required for sulfatase activity
MLDMKKVFVILFIWVLFIQLVFPGTRAEVISKSGRLLTLNKGAADGVKIGMTGIVKTIIEENGKRYDINVGLFTIRSVTEKTSEAYVTQIAPGMNVQQAKYVAFKEDLKPKPGTAGSIPPGKPIDWYLYKGDEYFDNGKYQIAKKYYQKVLELESFNPIAKRKIKECNSLLSQTEEEKKYYNLLKRADNHLKKGKVQYALEYYLTAYQLLPSKSKSVADKFKHVSLSHPEEWKEFKSEHSSELKSILDKYFIPPEVNKIKSKAKKVYKNKKGFWEAEFEYDIVMIYIPEGEFSMGSNEGHDNEKPVHSVYLHGYWIGKYEVTQGQWKAVMGNNPSLLKRGDNYPVEKVSWDDVQNFIKKLSSKIGLSFRLPTEAQWEKAARGTDRREYPWGNGSPFCSLANYGDCLHQTKPVGSYPSGVSPYGAHDMAGNVLEWCSDWYSSSYYTHSPRKNPTGPSSGSYRVRRGGCWNTSAALIRCVYRFYDAPSVRYDYLGFRLSQD